MSQEEHRYPVIAGLIRDIEPLPKGGEWVKKLWDRLLQLNKERGALHETPTVSLLPGSAIKP